MNMKTFHAKFTIFYQFNQIVFFPYLQNEEMTKCSIEEFAVYFLNFVRNQTEE